MQKSPAGYADRFISEERRAAFLHVVNVLTCRPRADTIVGEKRLAALPHVVYAQHSPSACAQAAQDNHFMHSSAGGASAAPGGGITKRVLREFAALHHELTEARSPPL